MYTIHMTQYTVLCVHGGAYKYPGRTNIPCSVDPIFLAFPTIESSKQYIHMTWIRRARCPSFVNVCKIVICRSQIICVVVQYLCNQYFVVHVMPIPLEENLSSKH